MSDQSDSDYDDGNNVDHMEVDLASEGVTEQVEDDNEIKVARRAALQKIKDEASECVSECESGASGATGSAAERQLAYLMSQSEVFAHFLTDGDVDAVAGATDKRKKSKKKSSGGLGGGVSGASGGGRTRMSEEAEDRRLMKLAQAQSKGKDLSRVSEQPRTIAGGTMRSYQVEGLNWMIKLHDNSINGILADEMGLGKTLQTISLLAYLNEARHHPGPHLVVVPKSTVGNWMREFKKWCPTLRAVKLLGSKEERQHVVNTELKPFYDYVAPPSSSLGNGSHPSVVTEAKKTAASIPFNVLVTSYESCMREKSAILKMRWKYLVIDEAHRIKNEKSSLAQITRLFRVDHRLLVTGTPLQNNLHELWALLNFLMPEVFSSSNIFDSWFNTDDKEGKENVIKKLHTVLKPFMIRRVKVDVEKDLPPKKEIKLYIGLSAMQKEWYRRVLTKDIAALNALGGPDKTRLLNVLMQLRKVCNHPYLFEGAEFGPPYIDGPHIWESCGKMILLDKLLTRLLATGSRVLIFSQMTRMLDILEDYIRYKRYEYCRIDGNTSGEMREEMMDTFQEEGSTKFVFLLSTRAGGLGINLTTADTVIIYDSDFNPQMDLQAMDRAHRIGQKKEVRVFRFITEGTVEEKIIERADRKLFLDAAVIQQGRLTEQLSNNMNKNELMRMVKFGADAILTNQGGDFTDDDIETLLARGEQRTEDIKGKLQTEAQHTLANFSVQMEDPAKSMNLFEFAGENFLNGDGDGNDKGDAGRLSLGLELGTRERRRSNYDMINYTDDVDLDGNVKEPKEPAVRKLNKKNVFTLPDFQFFDRPRLDEIYTLEAELSAARADQVKAIKKLRHDDEIEMRRQERVARGWNATRNKKPDGRRKENKGIRVTEGGEATKKESEDGSDDGADDGEDEGETLMEVDETRQSEGGADTNGIDESTESKNNSEPVVKSDMALEADRLEEELGGDPFPNLATLSLEIQFYHSRALLNKDAQGTGGVGDIVSGKFNIPPAMQREKEQLILAGFPRWTKAHLRAFISGMERHGRDNLTKVANFMRRDCARNDIIPESEVRRYAEVYWQRHGELGEWQSHLRKIEKGDKRAARLLHIRQSLDEKIARYFEDIGQPVDVEDDGLISVGGISLDDSVFKIYYGSTGKGKYFPEEFDRCLILTLYKQGYGDDPQDWEDLRKEVIRRREFRFDLFVKSRTATEVQKRSDFLVKMVEKDNIRSVELRQQAKELAQKEERARKRALQKEMKKQKEGGDSDGDVLSPVVVAAVGNGTVPVPKTTDPEPKKSASKNKKKERRSRTMMSDAVEGDRVYNKRKRHSSPIDMRNGNGALSAMSTTEALALAMAGHNPTELDNEEDGDTKITFDSF